MAMQRLVVAAVLLGGCDETRDPIDADDGIVLPMDDGSSSSEGDESSSSGEPCDNAWCFERCDHDCTEQWPDGTHDDMQAECVAECEPTCADKCEPDAIAVCLSWCPATCGEGYPGSPLGPKCACDRDSECLQDMHCTGDSMATSYCECDFLGCEPS